MFECDRQENSSDIIHVLIEKKPETFSLHFTNPGTELTLIGFLRSINWHDDTGKRHLDVIMEAIDFEFHTLYTEENYDKNVAVFTGHVCTKPTFKITSKNRQITEFRIAVQNPNNQTTDYSWKTSISYLL